jgi:flagellar protein FliT
MASRCEVMHCYEQIAPLTERMLLLASTRQWSGLPALEEQYTALVERLKVLEPQSTLDDAQSTRKRQLLVRINANSTRVLGLIGPQIKKLLSVMTSMEKQQSLHHVYHRSDDAHL